MGFFGRSTAGDIPGRPRDPSCSRADVRLQLLVFSGRVVCDIGVCGGFVSTEDETSDQTAPRRTAIRTIATETAAWKTLTAISCRVCFPSARIRFVGPSGDEGPGPTFSPAVFYIGDGPGRFEKAFAVIGMVWAVPAQDNLRKYG